MSGGSLDHVLQHEVKELGTHILVCEVNYHAPGVRDKLNFRKFFKFQVNKPLDVKTKFYNAEVCKLGTKTFLITWLFNFQSDEVFLEAQVQNVTQSVLCLEKVVLDPSMLFTVENLNDVELEENGKKEKVSVFGKVNMLQHTDSRYLDPKSIQDRYYFFLVSLGNICSV